MQALGALLILPFMLLSSLGWLVAFVWLAILGEWSEIGIGIGVSIGMPFLFPFANLPGLGFLAVFSSLYEKGRRVWALPFAFLGSLWTNLLAMAWCSFVFLHYARVSSLENYIPLLLWGYGVAMAPLTYMAKFDGDNAFSSFLLFIAQVLYVGLVACFVIGTSIKAALIFIFAMALIMPTIALVAGIVELSRRGD